MCVADTTHTSGGYHSHRLYSHSCDRGSKLWPALFGSLTVDHTNFWPLTFDRSDILPAKESQFLNCNPSPRACMLGSKRPTQCNPCNPTQQVWGELHHCNLFRSALGSERWPSLWLRFDRWPYLFWRFDHWPLTEWGRSCDYRVYGSDTPLHM